MSSQLLPHTVGNYRVIAHLGQGGMARALLAIRQGPGGFRKLFVIKQLRPDLQNRPEFVDMFLDEARLAALMSHPNVVQTHEVGQGDSECFISMDYLEGQSLGRLLRRVKRANVPLGLHIHILSDVLAGLHYAHGLSDLEGHPLDVVHRDVSPGNVFVTYDGQVKLLDFGIAKAAGAHFETEVGVLKGKLAYMAPEQAEAGAVDRRSDVFSVGIMLWEALAGRRMVKRGETEPVTLNSRVNGLWQPISQIRPDASPLLLAACEKAMSLAPDDRFESAGAFREALLEVLAQCQSEPSREAVAELVVASFVPERAELNNRIAKAIESGEQFPVPLGVRGRPMETLEEIESPIRTELFAGAAPSTSAPSPDEAPTTMTPPSLASPRRGLWIGLAGAVAAGAIAALIVTTTGSDKSETSPSAIDESAAKIAEEADDKTKTTKLGATTKTVEMTVDAQPANVELKVDGKPIANPSAVSLVPASAKDVADVAEVAGAAKKARAKNRVGDTRTAIRRPRQPRVETKPTQGTSSVKATQAGTNSAVVASSDPGENPVGSLKTPASEVKSDGAIKAGDSLKTPEKPTTRKIDEENPYR